MSHLKNISGRLHYREYCSEKNISNLKSRKIFVNNMLELFNGFEILKSSTVPLMMTFPQYFKIIVQLSKTLWVNNISRDLNVTRRSCMATAPTASIHKQVFTINSNPLTILSWKLITGLLIPTGYCTWHNSTTICVKYLNVLHMDNSTTPYPSNLKYDWKTGSTAPLTMKIMKIITCHPNPIPSS